MKTFLTTFILLCIQFLLFAQVQEPANVEVGDTSEIFEKTAILPFFRGEDIDSPQAKARNTFEHRDTKLPFFIQEKLQYPKEAYEKGIEGRCVVSFVVEKDGTVSQVKAMSNLGGGCEEEAVRIVKSMNLYLPLWVPGQNKAEENVRTRLYRNVYFDLTKSKSNRIFIAPQTMPIFIGLKKGSVKNKTNFYRAESTLSTFIYSRLKYPKEASEKKIEGKCTINFIVEKDGSLSQIEATGELGRSCEKEAERIFSLMNTQGKLWRPGKNKRGKKIRVRVSRSVYFYPEGSEAAEMVGFAEQMPRFPGCENQKGTMWEKQKCSEIKLLQFIQKNIKYPIEARANGTQGRCFVQFIVEKDGSLSNVELIRNIGSGCGEESLRVVKLITEKGHIWEPGILGGRKVRVQFNLPVHFRLK